MKEVYRKVGESEAEKSLCLDYRKVNKIMWRHL